MQSEKDFAAGERDQGWLPSRHSPPLLFPLGHVLPPVQLVQPFPDAAHPASASSATEPPPRAVYLAAPAAQPMPTQHEHPATNFPSCPLPFPTTATFHRWVAFRRLVRYFSSSSCSTCAPCCWCFQIGHSPPPPRLPASNTLVQAVFPCGSAPTLRSSFSDAETEYHSLVSSETRDGALDTPLLVPALSSLT